MVHRPDGPRRNVRRFRSVWWAFAGMGLTVSLLGAILLWSWQPGPKNQPLAAGDAAADLEFVPASPQSTAENHELSVQVTVKAPPKLRQKLVFSLTSEAPPGSKIDPTTGQLRWTPTEEQGPGRYPVTIQAVCGPDDNLTAEMTFWIDVQEVDSPPLIQSPGEKTMDAGQVMSFRPQVIDPDLPPNRQEISISSGPSWVSAEPASGFIRCEPPQTEDGSFEAMIKVIDDGEPPLSHEALLKLIVRGDPWQHIADELQKNVWLVQMEVEGPKGSHSWPFATCCAIDSNTLLMSAREVLQLATWHRQGHRIWIVSPSHPERFSINDFRVRREFVSLANQPGDWIFVNLGLLITDGELPSAARIASSAEQQKIEEGQPIVIYGFSHDGGKITRFDKFEAEPYRGEVYLITRSPSLPGRQTLLEIKAAIPQNVYGSPIVASQGNVIGLYGESSSSAGVGVKDLHFATALDTEAITAWLRGDETDWVSPPISLPTSPRDESLP